VILIVSMISAGACAQTPIENGQADGKDTDLPDSLLGVWVPLGRSWQQLDALRLESNVLTWGTCSRVPYVVLRSTGEVYLLQFLLSGTCRLRGEASFLIAAPSDEELQLWICRDPTQFDKPVKERSCSWGILRRERG